MDAEFHTTDQLSDEQKRDLRAALRYDAATAHDAEEALRRIMSSPHRCESHPRPWYKKYQVRWIAAAAAGIAAVLLFVIGWNRQEAPKQAPELVLYSALSTPMDVEMTIADAAETVADKGSRAHIVKDEVVDVRLIEPDAANPLEERVISTPGDKDITIILSDATKVTLSAGSSLRFPLRFYGDTRTVYLVGEAYFVVAKDPGCQFDVVTGNLTTTALGTEFYVRAYPDQESVVSLVGGLVRVEDTVEHQSVLLEPGQDALECDGRLMVAETDERALQYWKDGYFYFQDSPLDQMMVDLGKWYNVNVVLTDMSLKDMRMHFVAGKDEKIEDIITRLNKFEYFKVDYDGNTISIGL